MSSYPPNEVQERICDRKSTALEDLRLAQARGRPILLRNYCVAVLPQLQLEEWATAPHLKEITPSNPHVTLFCQSSPGDFPQKLLEDVPFHAFLEEWERRSSAETPKASSNSHPLVSPHSSELAADPSAKASSQPFSAHPDVFLGNAHLQGLSSQVLSDIGPSPFEINRLAAGDQSPSSNGLEMLEKGRLWMGNANHVSHLHFDAHHGLLVTLFGHKRVSLYEPLTHIGIIEKSEGNHARFNPLQKPLNSSARPIVLDLYAGDALLIPLYWWHLVESVNSSIAINFWCYPDLEASKLKFGRLWPFARQACADHIKAQLSTPTGAKRSKWSLLTSAKTLEIVEALLRFKLPPSALAPSDDDVAHPTDHQHESMESSIDSDEAELNAVRSWAQLLEIASAKVRSVILAS